MIDLYTWPTPNGHKIHIMLEETGLEYCVHPIDIGAGDQFKPEFLAISPNNKIPAMVDSQGPGGKRMALAESGAMLFYLASKTGKFLPRDVRAVADLVATEPDAFSATVRSSAGRDPARDAGPAVPEEGMTR